MEKEKCIFCDDEAMAPYKICENDEIIILYNRFPALKFHLTFVYKFSDKERHVADPCNLSIDRTEVIDLYRHRVIVYTRARTDEYAGFEGKDLYGAACG